MAVAHKAQGKATSSSSAVNTRRGPYRSTSAPTAIRAGIVSATLQIRRVFTCSAESFNDAAMVLASGGKLNQTRNVRKNATQVRCNILQRGEHTIAIFPSFKQHHRWTARTATG